MLIIAVINEEKEGLNILTVIALSISIGKVTTNDNEYEALWPSCQQRLKRVSAHSRIPKTQKAIKTISCRMALGSVVDNVNNHD
jgi:hypothetical protein